MITQTELKNLLHYDPSTGVFRWRFCVGKITKPWTIAGSRTKFGYVRIAVNKTRYSAHRLAWLYVTGAHPELMVDHINGKRADNRFENLRLATRAENGWNESLRPSNKSGHKGICWYEQDKKWHAFCRVNGKQNRVGKFEKIGDAVEALKKFREIHHGEFANHG